MFGPSCNLPCPTNSWGPNCAFECSCQQRHSDGCNPKVQNAVFSILPSVSCHPSRTFEFCTATHSFRREGAFASLDITETNAPPSVRTGCGERAVTGRAPARRARCVTGPPGPVCATAKTDGWAKSATNVRSYNDMWKQVCHFGTCLAAENLNWLVGFSLSPREIREELSVRLSVFRQHVRPHQRRVHLQRRQNGRSLRTRYDEFLCCVCVCDLSTARTHGSLSCV